MDYFPPKTQIEFSFGSPKKDRWRLGTFTIPHINNQYNNHHYWVSLGQEEGCWHWKIWGGGGNTFEMRGNGFTSEADAANALDAHVAVMQEELLSKHLQELEAEVATVQQTLASVKAVKCTTPSKN